MLPLPESLPWFSQKKKKNPDFKFSILQALEWCLYGLLLGPVLSCVVQTLRPSDLGALWGLRPRLTISPSHECPGSAWHTGTIHQCVQSWTPSLPERKQVLRLPLSPTHPSVLTHREPDPGMEPAHGRGGRVRKDPALHAWFQMESPALPLPPGKISLLFCASVSPCVKTGVMEECLIPRMDPAVEGQPAFCTSSQRFPFLLGTDFQGREPEEAEWGTCSETEQNEACTVKSFLSLHIPILCSQRGMLAFEDCLFPGSGKMMVLVMGPSSDNSHCLCSNSKCVAAALVWGFLGASPPGESRWTGPLQVAWLRDIPEGHK